jgi:hypothetical protein
MAFVHGKGGHKMTFLSAIWNKFQGYIAGGAIAIALVFFFLWTLAAGKAEREREARLTAEDNLVKAEEEIVRYSAALEAAESRNNARQSAREELRHDEAIILENPVTVDCVASPAVRDALDILRQRRAGDPSERDRPE